MQVSMAAMWRQLRFQVRGKGRIAALGWWFLGLNA
jgi:hypothetical protein